jgi:NAD(P)H-flavin reductase/hemoglobin-like flavoprotein
MPAEPFIDVSLIKESFALLEPISDRLTGHFYAELFLADPSLRAMFPAAMDTQRDRIFSALARCVQGIDRPEFIADYVRQLGRGHRKYGVLPQHYPTLGQALIAALRRYSGSTWTPTVENAWRAAYALIARMMIEAAAEAEDEPATWAAQVISHQRRTRDIAVLTVRPDQPLPFLAGQYVSVETPHWPRVWRAYSMANAPRADNMLELHVKAVGAGWVSSALVYRTGPGDVLRLGPATGTMVLSPDSQRPLVCVCGGTGLAPIKAIISELARSAPQRAGHVFFGVRHASELYDLTALQRLAAQHGRLTVVPAVSDDGDYRGETGMLPDVVSRYAARFGGWAEHDVFASGSPAMIRATLTRFQELGVPLERVRYDAFGEL